MYLFSAHIHFLTLPCHIIDYLTYIYYNFLHNVLLTSSTTEFETMNKIGTIRDQYEWQPTSDPSEWAIEEEKLSKVQPLVDFINHAGELKSTKVCIKTLESHSAIYYYACIFTRTARTF